MLKTCNPYLFFLMAVNGSLGKRCEVLQLSHHISSVISGTSLILFPIYKKTIKKRKQKNPQDNTSGNLYIHYSRCVKDICVGICHIFVWIVQFRSSTICKFCVFNSSCNFQIFLWKIAILSCRPFSVQEWWKQV